MIIFIVCVISEAFGSQLFVNKWKRELSECTLNHGNDNTCHSLKRKLSCYLKSRFISIIQKIQRFSVVKLIYARIKKYGHKKIVTFLHGFTPVSNIFCLFSSLSFSYLSIFTSCLSFSTPPSFSLSLISLFLSAFFSLSFFLYFSDLPLYLPPCSFPSSPPLSSPLLISLPSSTTISWTTGRTSISSNPSPNWKRFTQNTTPSTRTRCTGTRLNQPSLTSSKQTQPTAGSSMLYDPCYCHHCSASISYTNR